MTLNNNVTRLFLQTYSPRPFGGMKLWQEVVLPLIAKLETTPRLPELPKHNDSLTSKDKQLVVLMWFHGGLTLTSSINWRKRSRFLVAHNNCS